MENLIISGEDKPIYIPYVRMDAEEAVGTIEGESYMEEPFALYSQVLEWVTQFCQQEQKALVLNMKLSYINSSSFRAILDCFKEIRELQLKGCQIEVNWIYPADDINEMKEEGEDLAFDADLAVNFVEA